MFIKIFSRPFTLYLFIGGYVLSLVTMLFLRFPILNSLWIAFVGGVICSGIWGFCIFLFTFLFSDKELSTLFHLPYEEVDFIEDENALTLDELYTLPNSEEGSTEMFVPDISSGDISAHSLANLDTSVKDDLSQRDASEKFSITVDPYQEASHTDTSLDADGKFSITVNNKTLRASPQDGANAIKKVLYDSED